MYFPHLRAAGWEPVHADEPRGAGAWIRLLREARQADAVVLVRRLLRQPWRTLLRRASHQLIFDYDDAVFLDNTGRIARRRRRRFERTLSLCDQVWAGNSYLAQEAAGCCPRLTVLPTSVETGKYGIDPPKPADTLDLVWIGSSSTRAYLEQLMPVLDAARLRVPNLRLKIVADFDLPGRATPTVAVPWSEAGEAEALASSHIGIAPMPNDPWTQGKCGCKVVQYMAAGLPVIASRLPNHEDLIVEGQTGLLVDGSVSWIDAMVRLASDAALRQQMGSAGRERARQRLAADVTAAKMLDQLVTDADARAAAAAGRGEREPG